MFVEFSGNIFNHGDEVTVITDYDGIILHGRIALFENDKENYYICHDYPYNFHGENSPNMLGHKWSVKKRIDSCSSKDYIFLHKVADLNRLTDNITNFIERGIFSFLADIDVLFEKNVSAILNLNLGILDKYDSMKQSTEQGFVLLKSSTRGKKLSIKFGRLMRQLSNAFNDRITSNPKNIPFILTDSQIEQIHNRWMGAHSSLFTSEIVSGEDIKIGYTQANYVPNINGALNKSCMVGKFNLLKIYIDNPDKISLMIFYDKDHMIVGRCLLWNCDDGKKYHDRVYFTQDWYEYAFTTMVELQGYEKIYESMTEAKVSLKKLDYSGYPYLDTFWGVSFKKRALYHNPSGEINIKYQLHTTNGQVQETVSITDIDAE